MNPSFRGSRLDADHPEKGVLFARRFTVAFQHAIRARPADAQGLGDLGSAKPLCLQFTYPRRLDRSGPALVDARCLGLGNPFKLALAPQFRFELGEDAERAMPTHSEITRGRAFL